MATIKQKLVASKMVENGGILGKAMIEAGYSKAMARNPYKLTRSKGWLEATENLLLDERLAMVHRELLNSVKINTVMFPAMASDKEICSIIESSSEARVISIKKMVGRKICLFTTPDHQIQLRAVELAYKVKGLLDNSRGHKVEDDRQELEEVVERVKRILPASNS